ncbi:hypothetical protein [Dyella humicola]|uniref:hypothetical protein n=1 Tax=Dyella humicola TaxID=2992126 RepID=UPI002257C517|nr:hypothetical protein [Dyella humicola]
MLIPANYLALALTILAFFQSLRLPGWFDRWRDGIGLGLLFLSSVAILALVSPRIRRAALEKSGRWMFYPSFLFIVFYAVWSSSLIFFPISE